MGVTFRIGGIVHDVTVHEEQKATTPVSNVPGWLPLRLLLGKEWGSVLIRVAQFSQPDQ